MLFSLKGKTSKVVGAGLFQQPMSQHIFFLLNIELQKNVKVC
jgi:hypothetical protein